ncbi:MAG TPA: ribosome maturation factor RimP [Pyrinomonadaceae bacterium]
MDSRSIEQKTKEIALKATKENGVEFVHLEMVGSKRNQIVRVFADKQGGITIDDCSDVSRSIEAAMDADDFMPGSYVLEVSSPGLDRELFSLADFEKFTGRAAKVRLNDEREGQKVLNGRISKVDGDNITFEDRSSGEVTFPYNSVAKANLKVDLGEELSRK